MMPTITTEELFARFSLRPSCPRNNAGEVVTLSEFIAAQALQKAQQREALRLRVKAAKAERSLTRARIALMKAKTDIAEIRANKRG